MPLPNVILVLLIGLVLGVIASVVLKNRGISFFANIILGVLGAALGAFAPLLFGDALRVSDDTFDYLLRALVVSFLLVLLASLFRPAKTRGS